MVIPLASYLDGVYNPETTTTGVYANGSTTSLAGSFADVSNYRGAMIQCMVSRIGGANQNALKIIPHHGPCPEFVTHDPFGADWGFFYNGKAHASPGTTELKSVFIDTQFCAQYLSVEVTIASSGASAILAVSVVPVLPKTSPRLDDFASGTLLRAFQSGDLNLVAQ